MVSDSRPEARTDASTHRPQGDNLQEARNDKPAASTTGAAATDNARLEDSKIIPKLQLTGAGPERKDWTVAIELGSNLPGDKSNPTGWGADRKLQELKRLAQETEGKSINFVVHAERPLDRKGKPCVPEDGTGDGDKVAACVTKAEEKGRAVTERYFIHDGKIDRMKDKHYTDAGQDIQALMKEAGKVAPSDKIGLIIQSHGKGKGGIKTGLGELPLDKTIDAIKDGLKGSGHEKLDILDFDACDMGNAEVLAKSSKVAKDVVASSGVEGATPSGDGQKITEAMRALMANTKMSGRELGETIVAHARDGVNGKNEDNATQTLANFDLEHHKQFVGGMDRFGKALSETIKDPANLKAIQDIVEHTSMPDSGGESFESQDRDLKAFAKDVLDDIKSGKFKGDTTELQAAAEGMRQSIDKMATAQYADPVADRGDMAGLTTAIPGKTLLDRAELAKGLSPIHQLNLRFNEDGPDKGKGKVKVKPAGAEEDKPPTIDQKPMILKDINEKLEQLDMVWGPTHQRETLALAAARNDIERAKDDRSLNDAIEKMGKLVKAYDEGPVGKGLLKDLERPSWHVQNELLSRMDDKTPPGWNVFIKQLKKQTK